MEGKTPHKWNRVILPNDIKFRKTINISKGPKGEDGKTPTEEELIALIEPRIPEPIKGVDGKTPTETELKTLIKEVLPEEKIVDKVLEKIPKPKDGKEGKQGPKGEDGKSFRFADLTAYEKQILTGPPGSNGAGVASGGTTGQKLVKKSDRNFDTEWIDNTADTDVWGGITGTLSNQTDLQAALDGKVNKSGDTMTGDLIVPDEAYGAGWNGSMEVPTKNAIYDKIQTISPSIGGTITSGTKGSVLFINPSSTLAQDNRQFYYDFDYKRLSLFSGVGNEVVTNGSFTGSAAGWTVPSGMAYSSNSVSKTSNGTGALIQSLGLYVLREYQLTYTISNWTVGTITPSVGGFTGTAVSANGTYTERFVALSTAALAFNPSNTARFTIDTVSVVPMIGVNTRSNLNVGCLSVEGNWANGSPGTTRAMTFNNDGSYSWTDYRFGGTLRASTGANSSGGYDIYTSGGNYLSLFGGNSGLTSTSLYCYIYPTALVHTGYGAFSAGVNAGSQSTPTSTLQSQGSFATKGRRVTSNYTLTDLDSVIYADGSTAACSGTPTYNCSHWTNQTDCEKWDAHGGCSWYAGDDCSAFNNTDVSTCESGHTGCTYETASCGSIGDEMTCSGTSGCSWSGTDCSPLDEGTCGSTSGCSTNYSACSWDGMTCTGGAGCDGYFDESTCNAALYFTGCTGTYYTCSGSYYTGTCSGTYGASCNGTSSCSGIDDSTNCGFETGCSWSTSVTLNLPSVISVPGRHYWIYNDSSSSADVIVQPYSGDQVDRTTSYTLGTYKDSIHLQAFSESISCASFNEGACTPSGCTKNYANCSWDSMTSTCSGEAVCTGIGDESTCNSTTYFSYCSGSYYSVKNWYLLSRS